MEEKMATVKRKAYVQTKLNFPVKVNDGFSTERKIQKDNSTLFINTKQAIKPKIPTKTQTLARYRTSTDKYKILRDDDLFDKNVKAYEYIKSNKCEGYTTSKYCFKCGILTQTDAVQKRNRHYQKLIAQIDCLFLLKEGQPIPASIISQFEDSWAQYDIKKLHETIIISLKHRPEHTKSTELQQLCTYVKKEISDHSYYVIVNKYPALGRIIEAVKTHGLENWVSQCITFLIDKTLEKNRPIFVGMTQAVTKVINKLQCGVTFMRGIGEYHESFIDFLVVLIFISTLATCWLIVNLAN
ncbi:hypothetical protein GLOIN_2v1844827 [Rhizophagus clarus]|uniref:Uncharacterized protein n=1 Tax=Rhizophagus clarus TaxID=94130 RepID=A0A8H3L646_9GLOM|nr:hypothetical protein GLOIN_2v1844827 [Rhizophagus clarus]